MMEQGFLENLRRANPDVFELVQRADESSSDSGDWFAEHSAGFGTVTAFEGDSLRAPGKLDRGARGVAVMRWYQRAWLPRHGLAPNMPNSEFANLLIPGVGLAPVTEFRVLITVFVLLIGPLNYWVLSRAKRLYLLVLTVPLGAAAVTLMLISYALLADGLATQVRARSYTMLDQHQWCIPFCRRLLGEVPERINRGASCYGGMSIKT
jgi:hypothetical protein